MLDIKQIRNHFDTIEAKLKTRGVAPEKLYELRDFDAKRRELIIETEALKKERNEASEAIGLAKRQKEEESQAIPKMPE